MIDNPNFSTLSIMLGRASSLPHLPAQVGQLTRYALESEAAPSRIAHIIHSNSSVAQSFGQFRRLIPVGYGAGDDPIESLLTLVGKKTVCELGIALFLLESLAPERGACVFDQGRCFRHSMFVGQLANNLLIRKFGMGARKSMFFDAIVAGLLHEFPLYILGRVFPSTYDRAHRRSEDLGVKVIEGFELEFDHSSYELAELAFHSWQLPGDMTAIFTNLRNWRTQLGGSVDLSALIYADSVAEANQITTEWWPIQSPIPELVKENFSYSEEGLCQVMGELPCLEMCF